MVFAVVAPYHALVRRQKGPARVLPRRDGVVQAVVEVWTRGVEFLSSFVSAVVWPRPPVGAAVVAPYQAQVRRPSGPARVLPRRNGIVQAVVRTWAQAVDLSSGLLGAVAFALLHES